MPEFGIGQYTQLLVRYDIGREPADRDVLASL
jgi:hypothetical protein